MREKKKGKEWRARGDEGCSEGGETVALPRGVTGGAIDAAVEMLTGGSRWVHSSVRQRERRGSGCGWAEFRCWVGPGKLVHFFFVLFPFSFSVSCFLFVFYSF